MSGNNTNTDILLAGAFAAFTVDLLVYPLDTLKTRLQSPDYSRLYLNAKSNTINRPALFRGLYQGIGRAFFTTYEGIKAFLIAQNPSLKNGSHLLPQPVIHSIASSIGELVSCAILTPAEVIKQNAQMVDTRTGGNATVQTLAKFRSNPLALWRGYTALAGRNLPFTALQFPMFERMKEYLKAYRDRTGSRTGSLAESGMITAISAGSAGSVAAVVTTPIDVIKTRIMLSAAEAHQPKPDANPNALVDALGNTSKDGALSTVKQVSGKGGSRKSSLAIGREIIAQEGMRGIWRGGALRAVWTMVGSGLYLGVYESGRIWLARRRGEDVNAEDLF
ncbi:mitochondrial carrier [Neofusicoccum parvum]|uniref:Mitochondrial carrier n=2 Tax=Neofusicoccum parvum TaxID=310453 RepID=A0ACB5RWT6_9PEZI|nr:putative mitochondrial carrier protein [Neofusicoccum parvum UCRNP2]GME24979.1 mitochondrial carrier [Neofusicoccum parvum]GME66257.1 mitochondrial carrier [Neofusicoccum parvum]